MLRSLKFLAAFALMTSSAMADDFPSRAIKMVVPYPAGGGFDFYSRALAERMGKALGQQMIVENKPGAATQLAAELVANAKPDGYTILVAGATMVTTAPHLYNKLSYKREDFAPIAHVFEQPMALYVNATKLPEIKSLADYIAYVKARPDELFYATTGRGITTHLIGETVSLAAGLKITATHYRGSDAARQDVLAGQPPFFVDGIPANLSQVTAGHLRPLAVTTQQRIGVFPDTPTFGEAGVPQAALSSWLGLMAPAGTPKPVIDKLHAAVVEALRDEDLRKRAEAEGAVPIVEGPEVFAQRIAREYEAWGGTIKQIGLKLD